MQEPKKTETKRDEDSRESSTGRAYEDLVSSLFTVDEEPPEEQSDTE